MLGRGLYGRPWAPAAIEAGLKGRTTPEPGLDVRFGIVMEHMRDSLAFYGEPLGLRMFRKHLGWYVEAAVSCGGPGERRAAKAALCRLESAAAVEQALAALWLSDDSRLAA
jgi:tRNA-dihydrouridine synthase